MKLDQVRRMNLYLCMEVVGRYSCLRMGRGSTWRPLSLPPYPLMDYRKTVSVLKSWSSSLDVWGCSDSAWLLLSQILHALYNIFAYSCTILVIFIWRLSNALCVIYRKLWIMAYICIRPPLPLSWHVVVLIGAYAQILDVPLLDIVFILG